MPFLFVIAVSAVFAQAGPVPKGPEPAWADDWNAALEEARERKAPLFVVIPHRLGSFGSVVYPRQLKDKTVLQLCQNFVCMIADDKRFPDVAKHIAVEYHKGKYGAYGQKLQIIFCRPDGREFEEHHLVGDNITVAELTETMRKVLRLYPKAVPRDKFLKFKALRDRAKRALDELLFNVAKKALQKLADVKYQMDMVEWAQETLKGLALKAKKEFEKIKNMLQSKDIDDKRAGVERLIALKVGTEGDRDFKDINKAVRQLLKELRSDPDVSAQVKKAGKIEHAVKIFVRAEQLYYDGKLKKAYKEFRKVVKTNADSQYAERAKERMKEIRERLEERGSGK